MMRIDTDPHARHCWKGKNKTFVHLYEYVDYATPHIVSVV